LLVPPKVAVNVTLFCAATFKCVTVKDALVLPEATVTEPGTVADFVSELLRVTTSPADMPVRVTVPLTTVVEFPFTEVGLTDSEETPGASIVSAADFLLVPRVAVIDAAVFAKTAVVLTVNVADVDFAATVTEAGTEALFELLAS
jgi:hypothetical protein